MRVVIVEDSGLVVRILTVLIERRGWSVVGHTSSAKEALTMIRASRPDLVTLDLNLPEGGSLELIGEVARLAVPVVVISGATYEGSPATTEAFRYGASDCIDKSFIGQPEEFWRVLDAAHAAAASRNGAKSIRRRKAG
ncbi:response regulator [Sphingomonas sp. BIUV-7]|uniref:Response regulator n=1 Tax=Sphingomonas natans TaxID=3063330 RepID=A0ABT8Y566_9SPHN|nr:response regulator [Sphingomonas sp. BIUV-7]MDO6413465.1 response regulator [Sphingomonas sp. BIUV-7]